MHRRHHPKRVEHFRDARGRRHSRRRQLAALRQHVDQEVDAPFFGPEPVFAQPERARDRIDGLGVPLGFLTDVEPHERQPKCRHSAEDVGQPAVGDDAVAGGVQRAVAEQERLHELRDRLEGFRLPGEPRPPGMLDRRDRPARDWRGSQELLDQPSRRLDALLERPQQRAVRLVGPVDVRQQFRRGVRHRQIEAQLLDLLRVEREARPASHQARAARDFRRDERVAVTITTDPRAEPDRSGLDRQSAAGALTQAAVERSAIERKGIPERFLEDRQRRPDFVERRRPFPSHFFRLPGGSDLATQRLDQRFSLETRHVAVIEIGQGIGDPTVLVLERAPHDFGGVGRDHQLDAEAADGAVQGISRHAARQEPRERLFDRGRLRTGARITLIRPAPANAMMLLGDVGEVQEVREAARDRQHRFDRHRPQLGGERLEPVRRRHAGPLGERTYALHALEERLSFLAPQRLAEQFAEQTHVVAQRPVRVDRALSRARYHEPPDATL